MSAIGRDVIAHRLRTLGHPTRVGVLWALDRSDASIGELAAAIGAAESAVGAHVRVLCRAGVVCAARGDGESTRFRLLDWPSLWLVQQLARRTAEPDPPPGNATDGGWR